jgi:hypothetical protein
LGAFLEVIEPFLYKNKEYFNKDRREKKRKEMKRKVK